MARKDGTFGCFLWRQRGIQRSNFFSLLVFLCMLLLSLLPFSSTSLHHEPFFVTAASEKGVHVEVQASWSETPLLQEAMEWAARRGAGESISVLASSAFFNLPTLSSNASGNHRFINGFLLLEKIWAAGRREIPRPIHEWSQAEQYSLLQEVVPSFLSYSSSRSFNQKDHAENMIQNISILSDSAKAKFARFEVEMAARVYSPAVEAHYSIAASAIASLPSASLSEIDVNKSCFSCPDNGPFVLLYAPKCSTPYRLTSFDELLGMTDDPFHMPSNKVNDTVALGKEQWRRELWLGEDVAGVSFLHLFPGSPRLQDADMVIVLFGIPLDTQTMDWYDAIRKWIDITSKKDGKYSAQGKDSPSSQTLRTRFLFGHLPLSAERRCRVLFQSSERKRRVLSLQNSNDISELGSLPSNSASWWERPLGIQGYGVEVSVQDFPSNENKPVSRENDKREERESKKDSVKGFIFSKLSSRYPSLSEIFISLADELETIDSTGALPIEEGNHLLDHLGFGMLEYLRIRTRAEEDKYRRSLGKNNTDDKEIERKRLETLCEVSSNLPVYVPQFASIASKHFSPTVQVQKELNLFASVFQEGESLVYLNRELIPKGDDTLYGLLERMKEFELQQDHLTELFTTRFLFRKAMNRPGDKRNLLEYDPQYVVTAPIINSSNTRKVIAETYSDIKEQLRLFTKTHKSVLPYGSTLRNSNIGNIPSRIHIDESLVFWMNDIETDPQFRTLPNLTDKDPLVPKDITKIRDFPRRNVYNLVFIMDPTTGSGINGLNDVILALDSRLPIRVGLLLVSERWGAANAPDRNLSTVEMGKIFFEGWDYLVEKVKEYGDTPYDIDELQDDEGGRLVHGDVGSGAFAIILDTLLKIQGNLFGSKEGEDTEEPLHKERLVSSLEKIISLLEDIDNQSTNFDDFKEGAEAVRYKNEKNILMALHRFVELGEAFNLGWSKDEASTSLINYYSRLREGMGSFLYPSLPTVLLNGVILTPEKSVMAHVQSETAAVQKEFKDSQLFSSNLMAERGLPGILRLFHAAKRRHRGLDDVEHLSFWHGGSQTFSWIPPLLAFYEQHIFLTGGLEVAIKNVKLPESPVSGVFLFPREPTLRTLDLLEKSLTAATSIGKDFRVTFLSSLDCQYGGPMKRIERVLHSLLTYTYNGSDEFRFSTGGKVVDTSAFGTSSGKRTKNTGNDSLALLRKMNGEKERFNTVHQFLKWVMRLGNRVSLPLDSTMLSNSTLWSLILKEVNKVGKGSDEKLLAHLAPLIYKMEEEERILNQRSNSSPSQMFHESKNLCQIFYEFISQQAVAQGELGRALGLEPPLSEISLINSDTPSVSSPLVFFLHGKIIPLDHSFTSADIAEAVYRVTPLAQAVLRSLQRVPFSNLTEITVSPFFSSASPSLPSLFSSMNTSKSKVMDQIIGPTPEFLSARTALLSAFLMQTGHGVGEIFSEVDKFPVFPSSSASLYRFSSSSKSLVRHQLVFVVDPSREEGTRLLMLGKYFLSSPIAVDFRIYMNPSAKGSSYRTFFKLVGAPRISFDSETGQVKAPDVLFLGLPQDAELSLTLQAARSWSLFPSKAPEYDLDSFVLSSLSDEVSSFSVTYELHSLVISGMVKAPRPRDQPGVSGNYKPLVSPTGLSMSFSACLSEVPGAIPPTAKKDVREAVVISASHAYFQSSLVPGIWTLSVHGPVAQQFYFSEVGKRSTGKESEWWVNSNEDEPEKKVKRKGGQRIPIIIDSFRFSGISLTYDRVWDHRYDLESTLKQEYLQKPRQNKHKDALSALKKMPTLNIFAIASGHTYEQFLRTMMQSVYHTSALNEEADTDLRGRRIKFWLLENYLSPKFKKEIVKMAHFYGFEVSFITYHWPTWLHEPVSKRDKLWAYKILFLDAMFPLEVDRILYLDADLVSLEDLHKLYNVDFRIGLQRNKNADLPDRKKEATLATQSEPEEPPTIAFPSFCNGSNTNPKTKHLRLWENSDQLWGTFQGVFSFHNSALFVVDLERFRTRGHGNIYRDLYDVMARYPNDNLILHQDLVNLLQIDVPIFTLDDSWLWCETWCSTSSRKAAKIIDVCANPLTNISKVENARLIHPDWDNIQKELDDLFQGFQNNTFQINGTLPKVEMSSQSNILENFNDDL